MASGGFPRFSILLPTHDRADVLPLAIDSILAQKEKDFELLVVGDGCTDNTAEVVRNTGDPRIRWFGLPKAPHFGYANRNIALRQARGELIAFLAHDDLWFDDHLTLLGRCFEDERVDLAYSRPIWITPEGYIIPSSYNLHDPRVRELFLSRKKNAIPAGCVVHRRHSFDKVGYWNDRLENCGDWDMWSRIIKAGREANFAYLTTPTCLHFRAVWRTEANEGPRELKAWRELFREGLSLTETLRIDFPHQGAEQEIVWEMMNDSDRSWKSKLRRDLNMVLDRRILEGEQEVEALTAGLRRRDDELSKLRARLYELEYTVSGPFFWLSFGEGFYADEGGWRWMSAEARLELELEKVPALVSFDMVCAEKDYYQSFPFAAVVEGQGETVARLTFDGSNQRHPVSIRLNERKNEVKINSGSSFIPFKIGLSKDDRVLSLRLMNVRIET